MRHFRSALTAMATISSDLLRLHRARDKVAKLVVADPAFAPIFQQLEAMIAEEEAADDIVARARAVVQNARGARISR